MNGQIPTEGTVNHELQSALDYACALGRMAGGHGPEVIWNAGSIKNSKLKIQNGTMAGAKLQALTKALNQAKGNKTRAAMILGVRRSTVSEWCAKLALCVLLVGCATPKAETLKAETLKRDGPPMPPMVQAETHKLRSHVATVESQAAAVAPPAPRLNTITLAWDKNVPGALTQVWSGPTVWNRNVWHLTNVVGSVVTLPCDKPMEFYRIRNQVGEAVSRWNDEGQP